MSGQVAQPDFRGYTGLGCLFAALLCIPGAAFAFLLFITVLVRLGIPAGLLLGVAFFAVWAFIVGRAFVPVSLEPTETGLITRFFRLHRVVFAPWSEVKLYHIAGALFAVGSARALPISWVVVRRHGDFMRQVSGHLM